MTEIAARHVPIGVGGNEQFCLPCQTDWPCDTARVLALLAAAERRVTELRKASDDLLNDEMSDLEHYHLDSRFREFAKRVRTILREPEAVPRTPADILDYPSEP